MSERIVIDPEELRRLATRMRGAALLLSSTGRELASKPLPSMPSALGALVAESLARVNGEVQDLAAGLVREAGHLLGRATWAEIGGGHPGGWMSAPGGIASDAQAELDPTAPVLVASNEQLAHAEVWAVDLVNRDEVVLEGDDAAELRRLVLDGSPTPEEATVAPLGDLTLAAGDAPEVVEVGFLAEGLPLPAVGGGAVGSAFTEVASTPTGTGILGCITVGVGIDAPGSGPPEDAS